MAHITFRSPDKSFQKDLRKEVEAYFQQKGIPYSGDIRLYIKTVVLLSLAIGIYATLMLAPIPGWFAFLLAAFSGFLLATIGFNVMHDANHGAYSRNKKFNEFLGLTMNFLGSNAMIWRQQHNVIHHTFTNVDGVDDDIQKPPFLRMCGSQAYLEVHRYQQFYMFFLYGISSLFRIWFTDFKSYFRKRINNNPVWKMTTGDHITFWVTKVLYVVFYIAIPISVWGLGPFLAGYFAMNFVLGFTLAIVFQLAHVVEETIFEAANEELDKQVIERDWTVYQMLTTVNFAPDNKVVGWLVGGLNYQVEHHLFPKISHVHYPAISAIVKATCEKHNIPYLQFPTFRAALASHFRFMRDLGRNAVKPPVHAAPIGV